MNEQISDVDRLVKTFISTLAIIITIGLIMVWSASFILAAEKFGSSFHYITRQMIYLGLAVTVAFVVSRTKYTFWLKYGYLINIFASIIVAAAPMLIVYPFVQKYFEKGFMAGAVKG